MQYIFQVNLKDIATPQCQHISILPEINFDNVEISCVPLQSAEAVSYGVFYRNEALSPLLLEFVELMKETV